MPNRAVNDIKSFMSQMDMADQEQIEGLLGGYAQSVKEYNAICEELRGLLKNGMVEEVEKRLRELDPTLHEQFKELRDPTVMEFLDIARVYGLRFPEADDIFDDLGEAVLNNMPLRPLIIKYRQIARSSNTPQKLAIIRQILAKSPEDSSDWEKTLNDLEDDWKSQLQSQARKDIMSGNLQDLKVVQETLLSEPWKKPVPENVLNKIQKVLAEEKQRLNQLLCGQLIRKALELSASGGDTSVVGDIIAKIRRLLAEDSSLQIAPELRQQLQQLEMTWSGSQAQAAPQRMSASVGSSVHISQSSGISANSVEAIKKFMRQKEMTDQEKIENLLNQYARDVKEYNGICEELRGYLKNGLVEEAENRLKEFDPPLPEQYKMLCDPTVKEFLDIAEIYDLESPEADNIFDELGEAMLSTMSLRPLIIKYRQIARSNNTLQKLAIIRQILAQNPEDANDWEQTLVTLEEEFKGQLQDRAKHDIISGNLQDLKVVQEALLSEPWRNPVNDNVLNKIQNVLAEERRRQNQALCEQLIRKADELVTNGGDSNVAGEMFARIHQMIDEDESLQIDQELLHRWQVAENQWNQIKNQEQRQMQFSNLLYSLEQQISANAPLEEVENTFYDLQRLQMAIPEITRRRVEEYRATGMATAKRKKMVASGITIVVLALLAAFGLLVFKAIVRVNAVREYRARLRATIDDTGALSDAGYDIIKEIEGREPGLLQDETIVALTNELSAKRQSEEERRAKFQELQLALTTQLEDYATNADSILELVKELPKQALAEHKEKLDELMNLHDERRAKYVRAQDATYSKLCSDAGDAFMSIKVHLGENNIEEAKAFLPVVIDKLREAEEVRDVSFDTKNSLKDMVEEYGSAGELINQASLDLQFMQSIETVGNWLRSKQKMIAEQRLVALEAELSMTEEMDKTMAKLGEGIASRSGSVKAAFQELQELKEEVEKQHQKLWNFIAEENEELVQAFTKATDIGDLKQRLEQFQEKYPFFHNREDLAVLMADIDKCQPASLEEYDTQQREKRRASQKIVAEMGEKLKELLLKRRQEYIEAPVYMIAYALAESIDSGNLEFFIQGSSAKDGVSLEVRPGSGSYIVKNVMGMDSVLQVYPEDQKDGKISYDRKKKKIQYKLAYPMYKANNMAITESLYTNLGPYGDWLTSLTDSSCKFSNGVGYHMLDQALKKLFSVKTDGMRSVNLFLDIANLMTTSNPSLGKGGEYELTGILKFKAKLEEILASLPSGSNWYSVTWKQPEASKKFYAKLQDYVIKSYPSPFSGDMKRVFESIAKEKTEPVPFGIVYRDEKDKWRLARLKSSLDKNIQGDLFIADHGQKESFRIGSYSVDGDGKFSWSGTDNFNSSMPKSMYVVLIKK